MPSIQGFHRPASFPAFLVCYLLAATASAENPPDDSRAKWKPLRVIKSRNYVTQVAFSPDGKLLAVANYPTQAVTEHDVDLWDVATGANHANFHGSHRATFSPDRKSLATIISGGGELWTLATGEKRAAFEGHENPFVNCITFSPDGKRIATCGRDSTVRLWEAATGRPLVVLRAHSNVVFSAAFAADGKTLASSSLDGTVRLWDLATFEERRILKHGAAPLAVRGLAMSPDSATVATAGSDGAIKVWDAVSGKEMATWAGHTGQIYSLAFAPDGKSLLSGAGDPDGKGDHTARLWNLSSKQAIAIFNDHEDQVFCVAFSGDGTMLATGGFDKTARVYELADERY